MKVKELKMTDDKMLYLLDDCTYKFDERGISSIWEQYNIYNIRAKKFGYFKWHYKWEDFYILNIDDITEVKVFCSIDHEHNGTRLKSIIKDLQTKLDCNLKFIGNLDSTDRDRRVYMSNRYATFDLLTGQLDFWLLSCNRKAFEEIAKLIIETKYVTESLK